MSKQQLVSVIMPAYNAASTIEAAIKSVQQQTYENFELLVIDDGSQDATAHIVSTLEEKDPRIRLLRYENGGVAITRNRGIRESIGVYICFLDADDLYLPQKIERELQFLEKNLQYQIVYCNMIHFDHLGNEYHYQGLLPSGDIFPELLKRFFGQMNTMLFPREVFEKVGYFDENFRDSEEWDFLIRVARAGFQFGFCDERLVKIRMGASSLSRFENQWKMKSHNVAYFQELFSSLSPEEQRRYRTPALLADLRIKLAYAYIANAQKVDFRKTLIQTVISYPQVWLQIFPALLSFALSASFMKKVVVSVWKRKQMSLYERV